MKKIVRLRLQPIPVAARRPSVVVHVVVNRCCRLAAESESVRVGQTFALTLLGRDGITRSRFPGHGIILFAPRPPAPKNVRKKGCHARPVPLLFTACPVRRQCRNGRPIGCAVSSVVEHYLDTIKMPILAIFSCLYFPFAIIARPFISLNNYNVLMASLVISKNPEFFIWVTSRVQVLAVKRKITPFKF